ncbi:MAG TPA: outer membrane beta-barrel protein [Flavitalea sp.]|nr:outer membrane beta-barrel protein [Flavitalea sp.]
MKHRYLILLLFFHPKIYSQTVTGVVHGIDKPLDLVNISLLKAKDSTLQRSAVTDSKGYYQIEKVIPGSYILSASRVGYQQQSSPLTVSPGSTNIEIPILTLAATVGQLNQVTLTGKRPFVEQKIDRMVVNVANSIIASGNTALEVLEKAPGIIIDRQNEQIVFRGKEGVIVQIDGRQTYLSMIDLVAMLRSMPSENIDRIELITNPSAKYDAAGNSGIIDIRLKKNNNIGTNGSVSVNVGTGRFGRQRGTLQLNHRTSRLNFFTNYSASRDGNYWNFDLNRQQKDGSQLNFIEQDSYIRFKIRGHNAKAGMDYFINKNTTVGVVWTGFWNKIQENSPAEARFRRQEQGPVYLETLTDKSLSNVQSNHLFNVNILKLFSGKGQISADFDLGKFRRQFSNVLATNTLIPASPPTTVQNLLSYMPTKIDIFSFRIDYNRPLGKLWKMDVGIKASNVKSDNDMQLSTGSDGSLKLDSTLSNHFKYSEEVYAGYISFSGRLNQKTDVLFGLRAENTHSIGNSITFNNKVIKNYLNLFPSLFLTHNLNKRHTLNFSYSYRIDRPNYQALNPARSYLDPYAYSSGNPFLTPQFTHSLEFRHGFKNKLFTSVGASYISDLVFFVVQPLDSKTTQRMPENIGTSQAYNLTVSFPLTVMKGWTMQNTFMGIYSQFQYIYKSMQLRVEQVSGRINSAHAFVFGKGWTGEISGRISTPSVNALTHNPWLGAMDIGLQKSFKGNWRAKLSLQDVFHTSRFIGKTDVPDFESQVRITMDSRIVMLTVTYSFGNQQLKNSRQRKTASEEEIQRTN